MEGDQIEVRDSPNGIFGSWAPWNKAPPDGQSSWEIVAAAVPRRRRRTPAPRTPGAPQPVYWLACWMAGLLACLLACLLDGWLADLFTGLLVGWLVYVLV